MGWLRGVIRRYLRNDDIDERREEVLQTLESGKRREAEALYRVAAATGSHDVGRRARRAQREADEIRERMADDVALDVFSGSSRDGGEGS